MLHLFIAQRTTHHGRPDFEDLTSGDEPETAMGCDDDAVEEILAGDLQDVFDGPERVSLGALDGGSDLEREVRDRVIVFHVRSVLSDLENDIRAPLDLLRSRRPDGERDGLA